MKKILSIIGICAAIFLGGIFIHQPNAQMAQTQASSKTIAKEWQRSPDTKGAEPIEQVTVPVLMYHQIRTKVTAKESHVTPKDFEDQIRTLSKNGYHAITIQWLYAFLYQHQPLPKKPILITFDDGYVSNAQYALPVLEKYHFHATIFPIGNRCEIGDKGDCGRFWLNDRQLQGLADSGIFDIGSHTFSMHDHVKTVNGEEALLVHKKDGETETDFLQRIQKDLEHSLSYLQNITGQKVISLAYPFGEYSDKSIKAIKRTPIKLAFTTEPGIVTYLSDPYRLPRLTVKGGMSGKQLVEEIQAILKKN